MSGGLRGISSDSIRGFPSRRMYSKKAPDRTVFFGQDTRSPVRNAATEALAVLAGILVLYETGKLIHTTHKHIKKHSR
jgi:hypothetical protein